MMEFKLQEEYIELVSLLKYLHLAESGGQAKAIVNDGLVIRNGEVEFRKRAKLRVGDVLVIEGNKIKIV